jgi:hypothetical protein
MRTMQPARHLAVPAQPHLTRPLARLQPILAKPGTPSVDPAALAASVAGVAEVLPLIAVESPEHWARTVRGLGPDIDAIIPLSIPAYPTEVWNSHPQPLAERGLPFVFWPLIEHDEPDFWRWSARDMLASLGVPVHLVESRRHGLALLRALGAKRLFAGSRLVVFGEQNFPWNAHAVGGHLARQLGLGVAVRTIEDVRARAAAVPDAEARALWEGRRARYRERGVRPSEQLGAVKTWIAIRSILVEERACGFGVNCFGDLIPKGHRDVPCLAQALAREEGYIAACDGDFCCLASMALLGFVCDAPCMMSNLYPVSYVGALGAHFGDPLSPDPARFAREDWPNLARLAHCGFVGVVPAEMAPGGTVGLADWGGTYEIARDGRGCGIDGELAGGVPITAVEVKFDGRTLLIARGETVETSRHPFRHCESSALLKMRDLPGFVRAISREHPAIAYGDHETALTVAAGVFGMEARVF